MMNGKRLAQFRYACFKNRFGSPIAGGLEQIPLVFDDGPTTA
jgi:hypothetical protein